MPTPLSWRPAVGSDIWSPLPGSVQEAGHRECPPQKRSLVARSLSMRGEPVAHTIRAVDIRIPAAGIGKISSGYHCSFDCATVKIGVEPQRQIIGEFQKKKTDRTQLFAHLASVELSVDAVLLNNNSTKAGLR